LLQAADNFEQFGAAVWGLNSFFGLPLSQNAQGELLTEIGDASAVEGNPVGLHTDITGILSFACWNPARRGGLEE